MPNIDIDYTVLITDEGEFCVRGGVLYCDNIPIPYVDEPEQEFYTLVSQEIDNLQEGKDTGSYIEVRRMHVWEEA